eukprot:1313151-Lingulodinium_polyedra.AAC.1
MRAPQEWRAVRARAYATRAPQTWRARGVRARAACATLKQRAAHLNASLCHCMIQSHPDAFKCALR